MNSFEVRERFFSFFKKYHHAIVPSSPLIPAQDPTLLFTNAGMNQFKDLFLGKETRSYKRAVSIQKCVRAGGKHNDLDQVGFTKRHLTFFEMMGNFSFGDYFKREAIRYAWEFCTSDLKLPKEKLYVTVFERDDEAYDLWHNEIGVEKKHIVRLGEKDNFWQMGDVGPCGPCSEIYIDRGEQYGCDSKQCAPGCDCDRFLEFWNLVFMQYNRDEKGTLHPLTQTGVDTGMGLDRLCMILQNKDSVFDIDLFDPIRRALEAFSGKSYASSNAAIKGAFNVVCDHIRSASLLIADGASPSNDGRGYVLRKIIRRAALFAQKLSDDQTLFARAASHFIDFFSKVYPELQINKTLILTLLQSEVDKFSNNLLSGQAIFETYVDEALARNKSVLSGAQAFKLYDTYGFPLELTIILARDKKLEVDTEGFEIEMQRQKEQSGKKKGTGELFEVDSSITTNFVGYEQLESKSPILFAHQEDDQHVWIVTQESPFYVESGGQVNDEGWLSVHDHSFPVVDLKKIVHSADSYAIALKVDVSGATREQIKYLQVDEIAHCVVDLYKRMNTVRNHTATHLLQAALRQILGKGVKQAGSVVHDRFLRFDFSHHEPLTLEQVHAVEKLINTKIQDDIHLKVRYTTLKEAQESGVISFFGEKYNPEKVRVVEVPGFSAELCGGTHASSTGIIGCFKITSETALSSGVRRIVAVTGPEALAVFQDRFDAAQQISTLYKVKPEEVAAAVRKEHENYHEALREIKQLKKQLLSSQVSDFIASMQTINSIPVLYLELEDKDNEDLKVICTSVEKQKPGAYLLVSRSLENPSEIRFMAHVSPQFSSSLKLRTFAAYLKSSHNLKGGGNDLLIQGGGVLVSSLEAEWKQWIMQA